jgi:hypothetical protein
MMIDAKLGWLLKGSLFRIAKPSNWVSPMTCIQVYAVVSLVSL